MDLYCNDLMKRIFSRHPLVL